MNYQAQRQDLAAAFRFAARCDLHEAVANHFSLATNASGTEFLINPNQYHFSLIRASDLLHLDAHDPDVLSRPDAPDLTAWGLHASIHRLCPQARCVMHVHSLYSTALSCLENSTLPPIDLNTATFFRRHVVDQHTQGLAFEAEGERCAQLLNRSQAKVMIMSNHGLLVIGETVADTFNRLYYFERAAKTYLIALQSQQPLKRLTEEVAERIAQEIEHYPGQAEQHFNAIHTLLRRDEPDYLD